MAKKSKFSSVSDQKRVARGEHWLLTRSILRARDRTHHAKWKVLTIAGNAPHEEIKSIRALMPKATIVSIDADEHCASVAMDSGADEVMCVDLCDYRKVVSPSGSGDSNYPPLQVWSGDEEDKYDAICLDLCGSVTPELSQVVKAYLYALRRGGVMIVTFSYGRDVLEYFLDAWRSSIMKASSQGGLYEKAVGRLSSSHVEEKLAARIYALLKHKTSNLRSVIQYIGNEMPMCSCLLTLGKIGKSHGLPPLSFVKLEDSDFDLLVTQENVGDIYACPSERIQLIRRKRAAAKAVQTREARTAANQIPLFVNGEKRVSEKAIDA